jgi:thiol:disulfide interchange protein DsbA
MNPMLARCWPVLLAGLFAATAAHADAVQGRDYRLLAPAQPSAEPGAHPGKVEVIEFFSYGCPHCAHFHPSVTQWASELPSDAVFVRVPVSFGRREWGQLVRAYYALQATGQLERLDGALFKAIHEQHKPLFDEGRLAAWIAVSACA